VDIHNREIGVTFVSVDVPMVQFGQVSTDPTVVGWIEHFEPSATLYSYVMNNYWETNYRAGQDGFHEFHYSLQPHAGFNEAQADRFAAGVAQPLVVLPVDPDTPRTTFPVRIEAASTVVTSLALADDGDGYFLRLFNPSDTEDTVVLRSQDDRELTVYRSDGGQQKLERISDALPLGQYEIVTLRIAWPD
jgi:alpha-mannosidase